MIPFKNVQLAARRHDIAFIEAQPSAARYRRAGSVPAITLNVRTSEPQKVREMKQGGFNPVVEIECYIALPIPSKRPESKLDFIEIVDIDGEFRSYQVETVAPTRGTACYKLGLKSRSSKPIATPPPAP